MIFCFVLDTNHDKNTTPSFDAKLKQSSSYCKNLCETETIKFIFATIAIYRLSPNLNNGIISPCPLLISSGAKASSLRGCLELVLKWSGCNFVDSNVIICSPFQRQRSCDAIKRSLYKQIRQKQSAYSNYFLLLRSGSEKNQVPQQQTKTQCCFYVNDQATTTFTALFSLS